MVEAGATDLALALPDLNVLDVAATTHVNKGCGSNEHVMSRNDIWDRRKTGVVPGNPDSDRNIVDGASKMNWEKTVETEQELCATVVIR